MRPVVETRTRKLFFPVLQDEGPPSRSCREGLALLQGERSQYEVIVLSTTPHRNSGGRDRGRAGQPGTRGPGCE